MASTSHTEPIATNHNGSEQQAMPHVLQVGSWRIDMNRLTIANSSHEHKIAAKPMQVLQCLLSAANQTVSRQALTELVWAGNQYVAPKGINNAIWALRQIFTDETIRIITVPKQGYCLKCEFPITPYAVTPAALPNPSRRFLRYVLYVLPAMLAVTVTLSIYSQWQFKLPSMPRLLIHSEALQGTPHAAFAPAVAHGRNHVLYSGRDIKGLPDIFLYSMDDHSNRALTRTPYPEYAPQWSPDSQAFAYTRSLSVDHCEVVLQQLDHSDPTVIDQCYSSATTALAWSGDDRLAYVGDLDGAPLLTVRHGQQVIWRRVLDDSPGAQSTLSWSPDSNRLLYSHNQNHGQAELTLFDATGGERVQIMSWPGRVSGHTWLDQDTVVMSTSHEGTNWLWSLDVKRQQAQPFYTSAAIAIQPDYDPENGLLIFQQQTFKTDLMQVALQQEPQRLDLPQSFQAISPAPCGANRLVFASNHTGANRLWLHDSAAQTTQPMTPGQWQAHSPACDASGRWLSFLGHCHANDLGKNPLPDNTLTLTHIQTELHADVQQLCLMDLERGTTQAMNTQGEVTGQPGWHEGALFFPRRADPGHSGSPVFDAVLMHTDGTIRATHPLPHSAGLVRYQPGAETILFSSPQHPHLWRAELNSGRSHRTDIELTTPQWALWDITPDGLMYISALDNRPYLVLRPWEAPSSERYWPITSINLGAHSRLRWDQRRQHAWMTHLNQPVVQLRTADLDADLD